MTVLRWHFGEALERKRSERLGEAEPPCIHLQAVFLLQA